MTPACVFVYFHVFRFCVDCFRFPGMSLCLLQGFKDLHDGIMRTPLDPMITFVDDPLRVMRAVRFGGRYAFPLHPDIVAAIQDPGIRVSHQLYAVLCVHWRNAPCCVVVYDML